MACCGVGGSRAVWLPRLRPGRSPGGRGKGRLAAAAERIVAEAIRDEYLTKQKKRARPWCAPCATAAACSGPSRPRPIPCAPGCAACGPIWPPAPVRGPIAPRPAASRPRRARRRRPARPMAVLQIDHTPVDLLVVDETWRKPIGRPWLTLAIDVHSRCIAGLHLSFEAPSATVAGLCLAHAALDKAAYLRGIGVEADWPCQGRPGEVFVDNGPEFHSDAFKRGCGQHGIILRHRPPGAPHWGGIIERVIGTAMAMVHELARNHVLQPCRAGRIRQRKAACLTLAELERWLVLAVTGPYHNAVHGGVGEPPLARWRAGVAEHGTATGGCGRPGVPGGLPARPAAPGHARGDRVRPHRLLQRRAAAAGGPPRPSSARCWCAATRATCPACGCSTRTTAAMSRCHAATRNGRPSRCTSTVWRWRTCGRRAGRQVDEEAIFRAVAAATRARAWGGAAHPVRPPPGRTHGGRSPRRAGAESP